MSAFEVVVIAVGVLAVVIAIAAMLAPNRGLPQLGRRGHTWFAHPEELDHADRPQEDQRDDPIPRRPLRGRPE